MAHEPCLAVHDETTSAPAMMRNRAICRGYAEVATAEADSLSPVIVGTSWICTRRGAEFFSFFATKLTDGIPVRAKDFSQSEVEGPRMLPSRNASPGQRVHDPPWTHCEQLGISRSLIDRTSFNCAESRQMSMKRCWRTLPHDNGNCTQG